MTPYLFPTNLQISSQIYKYDINVNISICRLACLPQAGSGFVDLQE